LVSGAKIPLLFSCVGVPSLEAWTFYSSCRSDPFHPPFGSNSPPSFLRCVLRPLLLTYRITRCRIPTDSTRRFPPLSNLRTVCTLPAGPPSTLATPYLVLPRPHISTGPRLNFHKDLPRRPIQARLFILGRTLSW